MLGRRWIREAADLGWGEHRYALPELVRGAARLLGKKPSQLLPGQPVAVQGVIAFLHRMVHSARLRFLLLRAREARPSRITAGRGCHR